MKAQASKEGKAASSDLCATIEPRFRLLVEVLQAILGQSNAVLSLSELGKALKMKDAEVYKKAGVAGAKKYTTLAREHGLVVFSTDKAGSKTGMKTGEFVGLDPRLSRKL